MQNLMTHSGLNESGSAFEQDTQVTDVQIKVLKTLIYTSA